jgi:hypothetical protein
LSDKLASKAAFAIYPASRYRRSMLHENLQTAIADLSARIVALRDSL